MADIVVSQSGYRKFIQAMRTAFNPPVPFVATYNQNAFNYVVQAGAVANLYLTSVTRGGATRQLAAAEVAYSPAAIGQIQSATLTTALGTDFCAQGAWSAAVKKYFDVMLLCTVEAARSKYIYTLVSEMLKGGNVDGDHLKAVAQMYGHTQEAARIASFKPLAKLDYRALYLNKKELGNVDLGQFQTMNLDL